MASLKKETQTLIDRYDRLANAVEEQFIPKEDLDKACQVFLFLLKQKVFNPRVTEVIEGRRTRFHQFWKRAKEKQEDEDRRYGQDDKWVNDRRWEEAEWNPERFDTVKTIDLKRWKEGNETDHTQDEEIQALRSLKPNELPPELNNFLLTKEIGSVVDLLDPEVEIGPEECRIIDRAICEVSTFRKRKIRELVTHRFANTAHLDIDIEQFIFATHAIADKTDLETRKKEIASGGFLGRNFSCAVLSSIVPQALDLMNQKIEEESASLTLEEAERVAFKYYIFFEAIHPFSDGNGRTGRALFTFLVRKFTRDNPKKYIRFPHIPIARYDTETVENPEGKSRSRIGSLAMGLNRVVSSIMKDEGLRKILDLKNQYKNTEDPIPMLERAWEIIKSQSEGAVDEFLQRKKEIVEREGLDDRDFREIKEKIAAVIKINGGDIEQSPGWR